MNREGWGEGPWDGEPDKLEWRDEATGMPCLIVRSSLGALCGYVGVPPGHPDHGKHYDNVDSTEVHGGLTYANRCQEGGKICHIAKPGEPEDVWWFGFDTAHLGDLVPGMVAAYAKSGMDYMKSHHGDEYRNLEYVKGEVTRLALQLDKIGKNSS